MVPDDLTVRILEQHIQILEMQELLLPEQHTLILDGLPRNYAQAERLDAILDVIQIFHLKIKDTKLAMERLKARALRENRLDDMNEEVIRRRLNTYYEETYKTLSFYPPEIDLRGRRRPVHDRRAPRHRQPALRGQADRPELRRLGCSADRRQGRFAAPGNRPSPEPARLALCTRRPRRYASADLAGQSDHSATRWRARGNGRLDPRDRPCPASPRTPTSGLTSPTRPSCPS